MALRVLSVVAARDMSSSACGGEEPAATERAELEPLSVTQWTGKSELFAEYPPLVVGQTSRFAIHLTDISNFKAVTSGQVEVRLEGGGAAPETFRVDAPSRPGIFGVDVKPARAGARELVIALKSASLTDTHRVPDVTVYPDQQAARKAVEAAPAEAEGISFLKEQQWALDFGTRVAEERAIRESIRVPATIVARPGGAAQVVAPIDGRLIQVAPRRTGQRGDAGTGARATAAAAVGARRAAAARTGARRGGGVRSILPYAIASALSGSSTAGASPQKRLDEARAVEAQALARRRAADAQIAQYNAARSGTGAGSASGLFILRSPIAGALASRQATTGANVSCRHHALRGGRCLAGPCRGPDSRSTGRAGAARRPRPRSKSPGREPIPIPGRATTLGKVLDPETRTLPIVFALDNRALRLPLGQSVFLRLLMEETAPQDGDSRLRGGRRCRPAHRVRPDERRIVRAAAGHAWRAAGRRRAGARRREARRAHRLEGRASRAAGVAVDAGAGARPRALEGAAMIDKLIRWSLAHRPIVMALATAFLVWGGWTASRMPLDVLPDLTAPTVTILVEAPGMDPLEIEPLVTLPIESALNGSVGVRRVRSATAVGVAVVWVEFDWGQDVARARQTVTEKLTLVAGSLPPGVEPPFLAPVSSIMGEVLFVDLESDRHSPIELRTTAETVIRRRLLAVPGVSQVIATGGEQKQYEVVLDPARLQAHDVTIADVERALTAANRNATAGFTAAEGQEYLVRGVGRFSNAADIGATVVKIHDTVPVLVRDLGTVQIGVGHQARRRIAQREARGHHRHPEAAGREHAAAHRANRRDARRHPARAAAGHDDSPRPVPQRRLHRAVAAQPVQSAHRRRRPRHRRRGRVPDERARRRDHAARAAAVAARGGGGARSVRPHDQQHEPWRAGDCDRRARRRRDYRRRERRAPAARERQAADRKRASRRSKSCTTRARRFAIRSCLPRSSSRSCSCRCFCSAASKGGC